MIFKFVLRLSVILCGAVALGIAYFLIKESLPLLSSGGIASLFGSPSWNPTEGLYNLLPMAAATLTLSLTALGLALPLGLGVVLYARFYAPKSLAILLRRLLELLAGIPSVVYGFWGLSVLVPWIAHWQPPGQNFLAAALILTLMILPTFALLAEAALISIPAATMRAAQALGLRRWSLISRVALPCAKRGIATGALLALGRALGETMAVLMVAGNVVQWPRSLFAPLRTLSANIALEMSYAEGMHRSALFASGLLLLLTVALLIFLSERIRHDPAL